eukprot:CAMPEP_0185385124 /NCGR_PEP_ID=MMETSP1364-20130426/61356_1 /TAXON_ID=38817 /ORGANISM="Gephyrocapsa oceanica, Strain RCC1303" /LENGTH=345 /DNA_ID=CAMNT_0027986907 /DNA_START=52 /DNA_END=1086 /DNA_ORIENTATION=-
MSKRALHEAARARTLLADYTCEVRGPKHAQEHRCTLSLLSKGVPEHTATGEWCPAKKKAEESAAAACLPLLTLDSSSTGPTRPPKPSRTAAAPYEEGRKPNPRRLLYLLNKADRDEVCRLHRQWRDRFSPIHLSCAWTVLGRSLASEPAAARTWWIEQRREALDALGATTLASFGASYGHRELANTLAGLAKVYGGGHGAPSHRQEARWLLSAAAPVAARLVGSMSPQEVASLVWAFSRLLFRAAAVFDAAAERSLELLAAGSKGGEGVRPFEPLEVSSLVLSFAQQPHDAPALFDAIAGWALRAEATPRLSLFDAQGVCNLLWSFAATDHAGGAPGGGEGGGEG